MWFRKFGVACTGPPDGFLENSTTRLMKAVCVIAEKYPDKLVDVLKTLYREFWVERKQLWHKEQFGVVLEEVLGKDVASTVVEMSEEEVTADQLKANTEMAMEEGAFGLPYFVAVNEAGEKETFWGFDHLGMLTDHLGLHKPLPQAKGEDGWKVMT